MSIKDMLQKIKSRLWGAYTPHARHVYRGGALFLLIIVCVCAFMLGHIHGIRQVRTPIILGSFDVGEIRKIAEPVASKESEERAMVVVASKKGKSYHLPSCPGAKTILEENKIFFVSTDEARRAGYEPAKNCTFSHE